MRPACGICRRGSRPAGAAAMSALIGSPSAEVTAAATVFTAGSTSPTLIA
jgi:hypothetical protein